MAKNSFILQAKLTDELLVAEIEKESKNNKEKEKKQAVLNYSGEYSTLWTQSTSSGRENGNITFSIFYFEMCIT